MTATRNVGRRQDPAAPGQVLVASGDDSFRQVVRAALRQTHHTATFLRSGAGMLVALAGVRPVLSLLDQDLVDLPGLRIAQLTGDDHDRPFVLVGHALTTSVTVAAMKAGAVTVLEKPVQPQEIVAVLQAIAPVAAPEPRALPRGRGEPPRSVAERWAMKVLRGCEAEGDLRTLGDWAAAAGLSYSSLCEICRLAGIRPLAARDLTRVLRALMQSRAQGCRIGELLDICDSRTLNALMSRAAVDPRRRGGEVSVETFLSVQHFVPAANAGLAMLRQLLPHAAGVCH
jgi:CheY-like chemotaxis protein